MKKITVIKRLFVAAFFLLLWATCNSNHLNDTEDETEYISIENTRGHTSSETP